ncbi:hypothetical protein [Bradyrhizobium sp. Leo121]|uniref:hypothetical protein n=1 Tax=Bradyrhizobium sp. Leo121 TaxID=1571195 RepID=UPI00102A6F7B|nr:hypothetical protein [Bradyrhizobium sp. Leo121]
MPILKNSKHERFAQDLAKGKTADEAYVLAGHQENRGNQSSENAASWVRGSTFAKPAAAQAECRR